MQAEHLCHICGIFHDPSSQHCELQQKSDDEGRTVPVPLVRDPVYRLRRGKQMKSSCLYELDDDSTISADSCGEESIYESEKVTASTTGDGMYLLYNSRLKESEFDVRGDFRPNLLLPDSPHCVESLDHLLSAKNIKNTTQNYQGIDLAKSKLTGYVSIANLPPFATCFETNFSNYKGFQNFVRASAIARNVPVPDLIPICDSDERHISTNSFKYKKLAKRRLRLKDKNNNTVKNPFNGSETHESGPSETFYRASVIETSRSFKKGLKPLNCVEETERKSPVIADKSKGITPVFKNIPKNPKSNKNKKGNRVSSNLDVERKILNGKETIKIQNEDSTLLSDKNFKNSKMNQALDPKNQEEKMDCLVVQNSESVGKDKEQVALEEQEMLKRHRLLSHQLEIAKMRGTNLQQNRECHAISNVRTQIKTGLCWKEQASSPFEVLAITRKEMSASDYLEYSSEGPKLFQILQAPELSHHQEQVEIQTTIDHKETISRQINNSYSPFADPSESNLFYAMKVITLNSQNVLNDSKSFPNVSKIVNTEKSDVNADTLNFVTPRTVIEVKKVALPGRRNDFITKPIDAISSTKVPYSINNSHFSQAITRSVFTERTQNATSKCLLLKSQMHQAINSEASNFLLISDPNNHLATRGDPKAAPSQKIEQNEAYDIYVSNATNSSQIYTPESLPVEEKVAKFSLQKDSKDRIVSVSPSHESISGSQVSFQNGDNSNLSQQVILIPENCKMSNSTLNSKISSSTKKLKNSISTESSKKEVWHKCTYCWKKFKTVKGFNNHIEKKHSSLAANSIETASFPKQEKVLEVDPKKSNTCERGGARFEIKMEPFDGKQSTLQLENPSEQSRNQKSSLLQEEEKWFSCLACCRVIANYHRMMKHLNDKHSGSFESARIMTAQTFKKADGIQI